MFTTSVANIGPHDEIVIAIEYQEAVRYDEGTFRLRFPMAITPRYTPAGDDTGATPAKQVTVTPFKAPASKIPPKSDKSAAPRKGSSVAKSAATAGG